MEQAIGTARVLVVEDDEAIADVLRRSLRAEGHEVRSAGDGAEALTAAEQFAPDLVVLDLGLPRLDGMEVCRRLRAESDVPILILTARTETEDRVEGLDSGADDYLPKPFERSELLARIRALLRRRPPRGSASIVVGDLLLNPDTREVQARRARDRADQPRVRAARVPGPQPEAGRLARAAARGRLGLRPLRADQHDRRLHLQPAPQARVRRRAATAPHQAGRRLRAEGRRVRRIRPGPGCRSSSASRSAGGSRSPRPA